jgi:hypothetical protein
MLTPECPVERVEFVVMLGDLLGYGLACDIGLFGYNHGRLTLRLNLLAALSLLEYMYPVDIFHPFRANQRSLITWGASAARGLLARRAVPTCLAGLVDMYLWLWNDDGCPAAKKCVNYPQSTHICTDLAYLGL